MLISQWCVELGFWVKEVRSLSPFPAAGTAVSPLSCGRVRQPLRLLGTSPRKPPCCDFHLELWYDQTASHIPLLSAGAEWRALLFRGDMWASPCVACKADLEASLSSSCSLVSPVRAGLVEKWKAEREARLARGEKEEEEEEEEEINIYAVTEEEVLWGGAGAHCLLLRATKAGPWENRRRGRKV